MSVFELPAQAAPEAKSPAGHSLLVKVVRAAVGAAVSAIIANAAFPALSPHIDKWLYEYVGFTPFKSYFYVMASQSQVSEGTTAGDLVKPYRAFCGFSHYCIQKAVIDAPGVLPSSWQIASGTDDKTFTVHITRSGEVVSATSVNERTKNVSYFEVKGDSKSGHVGYGSGCHKTVNASDGKSGYFMVYWGGLDDIYSEIEEHGYRVVLPIASVDRKFYEKFGTVKMDTITGTPECSQIAG